MSKTCSTEMFYDRGNHYEFTSLVKELTPANEQSEISEETTYEFDFQNVDKNYESYNGINVRLRSQPLSLSPLSFSISCSISFYLPLCVCVCVCVGVC